jgi:tetratricopeptide (TPR) repeat protein
MKTPTSGSQHMTGRKTIRVLNMRLLAGTIIVLAILAPALYFWNRYQTWRSAHSFLERAGQLEDGGELRAAADYLNRYLQLYPNDGAVRLRVAKDFDRSSKDDQSKRRAIELYYQALAYAGGDDVPATRIRLAELSLDGFQLSRDQKLLAIAQTETRSVIEYAEGLLNKDAENSQGKLFCAQGRRLLTLALWRQQQSGGSIDLKDASSLGEVVQGALALNAGDVELSSILAHILREKPELLGQEEQSLPKAERERRADQVIDTMVQAHGDDPDVRLARYEYRNHYALPNAAEDLEAAWKSHPDNVTVLLTKATEEGVRATQAYRKSGKLEDASPIFTKAAEYYRAAIKVAPTDDRAYVGLAKTYSAQAELDEAAGICRQGLGNAGISISLNLLLAQILLEKGDVGAAARADEKGAEGPLDVLDKIADRLSMAANAGSAAARSEKAPLEKRIALLRGEWRMKRREYLPALPLLKQAAANDNIAMIGSNDVFRARMLLGQCYAVLNQWDQAATAFDEASALDSQSIQAHQLAAEAWSNLGRPELALHHYEQASAVKKDPETILSIAQIICQVETQKPKKERNWTAVEKALSAAREAIAKDSQSAFRLDLLETDYAVLRAEEQGDAKAAKRAALDKLHEAEKVRPPSSSQIPAFVFAYERLGSGADVARLLTALEKAQGKQAADYLTRARLAVIRKDYEAANQILQNGVSEADRSEREVLQKELIQLFLIENRADDAKREMQTLIDDRKANAASPFDPSLPALLGQLAERALARQDSADAKRWEEEMQRIEGRDGALWRYYKARRLATESSGGDDPTLTEAENLQTEVLTLRPSWPAAHVLNALILQHRGKLEQAVEEYQTAIRLGGPNLTVFEAMVGLLYKLERYAEAEKYLSQISDQVPQSSVLERLELDDATRLGKWAQAIEIARQGVKSRPADPMAYIWLAQMLLADNKTAEAELSLQDAVQRFPNDPSVHYALLNLYVDTDQKAKALNTIAQFADNKQMTSADRNFLLAQGYELLKDREKADASYGELTRSTEDTAVAQTNLARQLAARDPELAEKALRRALELAPQYEPARRLLAIVLVQRGGEKQWREAVALVEGASVDKGSDPLGQALHGMLFAQRGGRENLEKAEKIVQTLVNNSKSARPEDVMLLAKIYEAEGKLSDAREQFLQLVSRPSVQSAYLAAFIDMLLRHGLPDEAETWLAKLEAAAPDNLDAMKLRARWLGQQNRRKEIEPLIEKLAATSLAKIPKNQKEEADFCVHIGDVYTAVKLHSAAEKWYRRARGQNPDRYEPLALSLACQDKIGDAIRLCIDEADHDNSPRPAIVLGLLLTVGRPTDKDFDLAEPLLSKANDTFHDNPDVLNAVASVRVVEQRLDDAANLYQEILKLRPKDASTMSNLATVLAEQPNRLNDSMAYVEKAIDLVGPQAWLLDTKGMILVLRGQAKEAVPLLETATFAPNSDPRYYFHLAVAYLRSGDVENARSSLKRAYNGDLTGQILTPGDRKLLAELEQSLTKT